METALGVAAGLGWGLAFGLGVALMVALIARRTDPRPPAQGAKQAADVEDFPNFGGRRA